MAYVYMFKDISDKIIYVGYTGSTLDKRMANHFQRGHLDQSCYNQIAKIEYKKYKTKSDAQVMEVFYINQYKPKYNKLNKQDDAITIKIEDEQSWKTYKVYKVATTSNADTNVGWIWKLISIGCMGYLIYLLFEWLANLF